jgi:hypothetical protein
MSVARGSLGLVSTDNLRKTLRLVGIVTRAELLATGLSREHIATAVRRGTLIPLGRGVYARATIARNYLSQTGGEHMLRVEAELAVAGPGAVASHESAARLFRIDLLGAPGTGVTLICPPERGWRGRAGIHLHAVELPADHVTTCLRLPTTTAARTVVDLARTLDFDWQDINNGAALVGTQVRQAFRRGAAERARLRAASAGR